MEEQPRGEFTLAVSTTRTGYDVVPAYANLQKFVAAHSSVHNQFNQERHLYSRKKFKLNRTAALSEWRQLCSA